MPRTLLSPCTPDDWGRRERRAPFRSHRHLAVVTRSCRAEGSLRGRSPISRAGWRRKPPHPGGQLLTSSSRVSSRWGPTPVGCGHTRVPRRDHLQQKSGCRCGFRTSVAHDSRDPALGVAQLHVADGRANAAASRACADDTNDATESHASIVHQGCDTSAGVGTRQDARLSWLTCVRGDGGAAPTHDGTRFRPERVGWEPVTSGFTLEGPVPLHPLDARAKLWLTLWLVAEFSRVNEPISSSPSTRLPSPARHVRRSAHPRRRIPVRPPRAC
jgi:hypothetical protein